MNSDVANNAAKAAKQFIDPQIAAYCEAHCSLESTVLAELAAFTAEARTDYAVNLSGRSVGQLLKLLALLSHAKRVLDIGTFTGYSALSLAEGVADDGLVVSVDANPLSKTMAEPLVAKSEHGHKIRFETCFVQDWLPLQANGSYDMIFLDADKHRYPDYLPECWRLLAAGGLLVADNILWGGHVVSEQPSSRAQAVDAFNKAVGALAGVTAVCLPLRDGVMLVRKPI